MKLRVVPKSTNNRALLKAFKAKEDEFYTLYEDIEKEVLRFREHFKNKIVYCPCDDYEVSQFVKFFNDYYDELELKGLIASSYAYKGETPNLFNRVEEQKGKLFVRGEEISYGLLNGDGNFLSKECEELRNKTDIIVTNPPFSIYRDFFKWMKGKEFLTVCPLTVVLYIDVFPLVRTREVKLDPHRVNSFLRPDGSTVRVPAYWITSWETNIPPLELKVKYSPEKYRKLDNFDCLNISRLKDIPSDYFEPMGVPTTFFQFWNPKQFKVLHCTHGETGFSHDPYYEGKKIFARVIIQRIKNE